MGDAFGMGRLGSGQQRVDRHVATDRRLLRAVAVGFDRRFPGHARPVERLDDPRPERADPPQRQGHRALAPGLAARGADPDQRQAGQRLAARIDMLLGRQDQVAFALGQRGLGKAGVHRAQLHPHARIGGLEMAQHLRDMGIDDVVRDHDHDLALVFDMHEPRDRLVVECDNPSRIAQKLLARGRQLHPAPRPVEQRFAQNLFQPLDLHRHGRLRQVQHMCGTGDAAEIGNGDQGAQGGKVEVSPHITIHHHGHQYHSFSLYA